MLVFRGPRFGGHLCMLGFKLRRSPFLSVSHRDAKYAQSDYNHDTIYFHFLLPCAPQLTLAYRPCDIKNTACSEILPALWIMGAALIDAFWARHMRRAGLRKYCSVCRTRQLPGRSPGIAQS